MQGANIPHQHQVVLICNSRKFIFVHIHKCAGTSVEIALDACLSWNDLVVGSTTFGSIVADHYQSRFGLGKHSTASEIRKVTGDGIWSDYFTFAFVRHPLERLVSLYEFCKTMQRRHFYRTVRSTLLSLLKKNSRSLDDYPNEEPWTWPAMKALITTQSFSEFIRSDHLKKDPGFVPQFLSIADEPGKRRIVDYLGKVETIEEDWKTICKRIGVDAPLGRHNRSEARSFATWRDYYSPEDEAYVRSVYAVDFRELAY